MRDTNNGRMKKRVDDEQGLYVSSDAGVWRNVESGLTIAMGGSGGGADKSGILTSRYSFACTAGGTSLEGEVLVWVVVDALRAKDGASRGVGGPARACSCSRKRVTRLDLFPFLQKVKMNTRRTVIDEDMLVQFCCDSDGDGKESVRGKATALGLFLQFRDRLVLPGLGEQHGRGERAGVVPQRRRRELPEPRTGVERGAEHRGRRRGRGRGERGK